ncbi:MAG: phosphate signaling complex protein PhoU [Acidimicrobiales bacterium]
MDNEVVVETRRLYHEQLEGLMADTVRLAGLAGEQIALGTQALLDTDLAAAGDVVARDAQLDDLTHAVEGGVYLLLARQGPVAGELRTLIAVLRVVHEIERCGDLMVNVAKATRRLFPHSLDPKIRGILERMGGQAGDQLRLAITAFRTGDVAQADALEDMDDTIDDLQKTLFRTIFATGAPDEAALQAAVQVALVGRYFERIADHAVNISERVRFMVTGTFRPAADPDE